MSITKARRCQIFALSTPALCWVAPAWAVHWEASYFDDSGAFRFVLFHGLVPWIKVTHGAPEILPVGVTAMLLISAAFCAGFHWVVRWLVRQAEMEGRCAECGYRLVGYSPVCPECGASRDQFALHGRSFGRFHRHLIAAIVMLMTAPGILAGMGVAVALISSAWIFPPDEYPSFRLQYGPTIASTAFVLSLVSTAAGISLLLMYRRNLKRD